MLVGTELMNVLANLDFKNDIGLSHDPDSCLGDNVDKPQSLRWVLQNPEQGGPGKTAAEPPARPAISGCGQQKCQNSSRWRRQRDWRGYDGKAGTDANLLRVEPKSAGCNVRRRAISVLIILSQSPGSSDTRRRTEHRL